MINEIEKNDKEFVEVYFSNVSNFDVTKRLSELIPSRREKMESKISLEDKKRSAGVFLLLKDSLYKHGIILDESNFLVDQNGKPYLKDNPLYFSLSHSGDYVLVAISSSPIGCDIQKLKEINLKLVNKISNDADLKFFDDAQDKLDAFYTIWTFKESISKYIGEGLRVNFPTLKIDYKNLKYQDIYLHEFNPLVEYKFSIVSKIENISISEVDCL